MIGRGGWFKALLDLVFPPVCAACGVFLEQGERIRRSLTGGFGLCPKCEDSIPWHRPPYCPRCAATIRSAAVPSHACGDCISHPPPFDSAKAVMDYDGEVLTLVHRMKFEPRPSLARYLGSLLGEMLHEDLKGLGLNGIVPVPLHTKRLRERGFNQALLMSKGTAKRLDIPVLRRALVRVRWTRPQIGLNRKQRRDNVKGAFVVPDAVVVKGGRWLLVDDVYTSGATLREASKVLKRAGAEEVHVMTLARVDR